MSTIDDPVELRIRGFEILVRELGYPDAVRFLMQYDRGHGDYTKERAAILQDLKIDELIREAQVLSNQQKSD